MALQRPACLKSSLLAVALGACVGVFAACEASSSEQDDVLAGEDASDVSADAELDTDVDTIDGPRPYPEPGAWPQNHGPGGPSASFTEDELYQNCAFLDGGEDDLDHHNLVVMYDGYLVMPWAHEAGGLLEGGGLSFFDVSDPCSPVEVGLGRSELMRETHSVGFSASGAHAGPAGDAAGNTVGNSVGDSVGDKRFAVVNQSSGIRQGGVEFFDVSDPTAPEVVSRFDVDGFGYPDAYKRIVFSVFWQGPYVYAAGSLGGIFIIDASDPAEPTQVGHYLPEPVAQLGQIQVIGDLLVVTTSEGTRSLLLDVSDPANPQPIPGGDFQVIDAEGEPRETYFSNTTNGFVFYARKEGAGGLLIYDIHDPQNPTLSGSFPTDGNGGYVFVKDDYAFVGESRFAGIYDISDQSDIQEVARLDLEGDLDTVTPIGNVAVLSVDDDGTDGQASAIAPYQTEPDTTPPRVTWSWPEDGAENLALTSRVGLTFNEMIDIKSAWAGSVRVYETGTEPAETRVDGYVSAQENIVNFWPIDGLAPSTDYTLEVPAGGIADFNGNRIDEPFVMTFSTVGGP
jgi:hypothetical protein